MAEAVAAAAPPEAAPKKSKLLLIIVGTLVLCAVVGGGVYFTMAGKHEPAAEKAEGEAGPKLPATYVKLDPPFVVNFESKGMMRFLQITLEIMTRDPATSDLLKQHDPMIRNDLLLLFSNQTYETISTREGKEKLRGDALETVRKIIEREGGKMKNVEELYFTSFVMQ